ncbi:hypothetical protein MTO96_013532 [Rhipicephalus appendiculatus]
MLLQQLGLGDGGSSDRARVEAVRIGERKSKQTEGNIGSYLSPFPSRCVTLQLTPHTSGLPIARRARLPAFYPFSAPGRTPRLPRNSRCTL